MSKQRLFSSDEIIKALKRGGFEAAQKSKGGHLTLKRKRANKGHDVTVVPLGKRKIPRGTFDNILKLADIEYNAFLDLAKVKIKGRKKTKR